MTPRVYHPPTMSTFTRALLCALLLPATLQARAEDAPTLTYPNGLALDPAGNLYISDLGSHRIYKLTTLTPDRQLSVFAGTGHPGFSGDAGPATAARLNAPTDLLIDEGGNLLIADT